MFVNTESHWDLSRLVRADAGEVRGFVYRITSEKTGRFYIGSKLTSVKNWPSYTGSSRSLNQHMKEHPGDKHRFEVLVTLADKTATAYAECAFQFLFNAIHREDCWNQAIKSPTWLKPTKGTRIFAHVLGGGLHSAMEKWT